jgi:putative redox protein
MTAEVTRAATDFGRAATDFGRVEISHVTGDRFTVRIRDHAVTVDQPKGAGGEDTGPTPTELFVASLAGCVGYYVRRALARRGHPTDGLAVTTTYRMGTNPARVAEVRITVTLPGDYDADTLARLRAVAEHCTVHNSLRIPPSVEIELATTP